MANQHFKITDEDVQRTIRLVRSKVTRYGIKRRVEVSAKQVQGWSPERVAEVEKALIESNDVVIDWKFHA